MKKKSHDSGNRPANTYIRLRVIITPHDDDSDPTAPAVKNITSAAWIVDPPEEVLQKQKPKKAHKTFQQKSAFATKRESVLKYKFDESGELDELDDADNPELDSEPGYARNVVMVMVHSWLYKLFGKTYSKAHYARIEAAGPIEIQNLLEKLRTIGTKECFIPIDELFTEESGL